MWDTCEFGPLHEIAITNIVWCMAYKRVGRGASCIAQESCNSSAIVWAGNAGGGDIAV